MNRASNIPCRLGLLAGLTLAAISPAKAEPAATEPVATEPAAPATQPALEALNRQTVELYRAVQAGMYRVQLPQPKWSNAYAMAAIGKWDKQLDPEFRRQLEQQPPAALEPPAPPSPATRPAEPPQLAGGGTYIIVRPEPAGPPARDPARDPLLGGKLEPAPANADPGFTPTNVGLLLDDDGHLLVPMYVERDALQGKDVPIRGPQGGVTTARFLGSDRPTNLTLLQIERPAGKPLKLAKTAPEPGSLALCLAANDGSARLVLWNGSAQESGVIVSTDGAIAGVARNGQFLTGAACDLIARQLIRYGAVKRATLGVLVTELRPDDPVRRQTPGLDARSAMRVDQVIANSAADRAGLRPGDLVLRIANQPVADLPSFAAAIAACDGPTELQILRGSESMKLNVELTAQR